VQAVALAGGASRRPGEEPCVAVGETSADAVTVLPDESADGSVAAVRLQQRVWTTPLRLVVRVHLHKSRSVSLWVCRSVRLARGIGRHLLGSPSVRLSVCLPARLSVPSLK
jgi:hypothetical protein